MLADFLDLRTNIVASLIAHMEYPPPKYKIGDQEYELLSLQDFKDRIGRPDMLTPTLSYKLEHTDELDWVRLGTFRYIIYNKKAESMTVAVRRPRGKAK